MGIRIVTQTFLQNFRDCPQYAYQKNVLGCVPNGENTDARDFGSAIHAGLEAYFNTGDKVEAETALNSYSPLAKNAGGLDELSFLKAKAMLAGYFIRWPNPIEEFKIIKVEKEFKFPVLKGVELRGKIDVIYQRRDNGKFVLMDHKTSSRVDGDYILKQWMSLQMNAYAIGSLEALGFDIDEYVYDILTKSELRQKKSENLQEFYVRLLEEHKNPEKYIRQPYTKEEMRVQATREQIAGWIGNILFAEMTGFWGENTNHCFAWGRPCPYWSLCVSNHNSIVLNNGYHQEPLNPELEPDAESGGIE